MLLVDKDQVGGPAERPSVHGAREESVKYIRGGWMGAGSYETYTMD